jgi:phosphoglycolate phosphatase
MVFKAMEALGVERCIYVGESDVDIATAKNAGVPCLSVTWGFRGEEELRAAGAEHFCHHPSQLHQIIEELIKR